MDPHELYDDKYKSLVEQAADYDIASDEATAAMKSLKLFSECRPPQPEPEPTPDPVPTTWYGKASAWTARVADNETTRTLIKAAGAFGGIWLVVHTTIEKDHVLERTSLAQANQRIS